MIYHMMSRPEESRYWDEVARAERMDMQLRTDAASRATVRASGEGVVPNPAERTTPAPVLDWERTERILAPIRAESERQLQQFYREYEASLEKRGLCICPNCRTKVEKFGQYCDNCKF